MEKTEARRARPTWIELLTTTVIGVVLAALLAFGVFIPVVTRLATFPPPPPPPPPRNPPPPPSVPPLPPFAPPACPPPSPSPPTPSPIDRLLTMPAGETCADGEHLDISALHCGSAAYQLGFDPAAATRLQESEVHPAGCSYSLADNAIYHVASSTAEETPTRSPFVAASGSRRRRRQHRK